MFKKLKLRTKITLGIIFIAFFISVILVTVNTFFINDQNADATKKLLTNGFTLVIDELQNRRQKLDTDTKQLAASPKMLDSITFLKEFKKYTDDMMTESTYRSVSEMTYNIGKTAKAWKMIVYDNDGDLLTFVHFGSDETIFGYAQGFPRPLVKFRTEKQASDTDTFEWNIAEDFEKIPMRFKGPLPQQSLNRFENQTGSLCLVSYIPIFGNQYNNTTETIEQKQFGIAVGIQQIDTGFITRLARLTDIQMNLFVSDTFSTGTLPEYKKLDTKPFEETSQEQDLNLQNLQFNEIILPDGEYSQAVLPLFTDNNFIGAVSGLYSQNKTKANTFQMLKVLAFISIGCIGIFIPLLLVFINQIITKPLINGINIANRVAEGDLVTEIEVFQKDEIGQLIESLKKMADQMRTTISDVKTVVQSTDDSSVYINEMSSQLSSSAEELSKDASNQASSAEEISASMEQMAAGIMQNTDNSFEAETISIKAVEDAVKGKESVDHTLAAMKDISAKVILIEEISRQTDMLALNAAIEAARAGDKGKGFAVVAQEVCKLSDRSNKSANEIGQLVFSTVEIAENASLLLNQIVMSSRKTTELVQDIKAASVEQNSGTSQINQAIQQLDNIIQNNAQSSEELASASIELASKANTMADNVKNIKETIEYFKTKKEQDDEQGDQVLSDEYMLRIKEFIDNQDVQKPNTANQDAKPNSNRGIVNLNDNDTDFEQY